MKRSAAVLFSILFATGVPFLRGQAAPSAAGGRLSIAAGATTSIFQPDYFGAWTNPQCISSCGTLNQIDAIYPAAQAGNYPLIGVGAYVDVKFSRWVQIEAEGRWQRFNQYAGIYEDNYLIGPRLPVRRFGSATVYGKALIGEGKMHFDPFDYGSFTALAFGGGLDYQLTRKLSLRVLDAEYQYWPKWGDAHLAPYGASAGIGYRIF